MKSYEFSAKTVEKAIAEGLKQLGKNQEDVDIKILSEGGFFKKAKVVINVEEEPVAHFVPFKKTEEETPKIETLPKKQEEPRQETGETVVPIQKQQPAKQDKPQKKVGQQNKQQSAQLLPEEREEKYLKRHFSNNQTSVDFVQGLLKLMGQDAVVTLEETREESKIEIESESVGKIVGHRGECLNAIQYLANTVEEKTNPTAKRVVVDCGKYKVRHEEDLRALAIKIAGKVSETGKPYRLDPMTAYDRRIVHTELVNYPTVETHSEGVEPHRYIVVTRKKVQK